MKKITTLIALFLTVSAFAQHKFEKKTIEVTASFVGTSQNVFYFKDLKTLDIISFTDVSEELISEQKLNELISIGLKFDLTYNIEWQKSLIEENIDESTKTSAFRYTKHTILKKIVPLITSTQTK